MTQPTNEPLGVATHLRSTSTVLFPVVRYPGGKRTMLRFLSQFLPEASEYTGRFIEPFVGGAAVFLFANPRRALLSDSNPELIDLYRGISRDPGGVWRRYSSFGSTKNDYLQARSWKAEDLSPTVRAARLLYLNRTCFKGNWRHNANGEFNVGYGGQSRRWVISESLLMDVSRALSSADLSCADFEETIELASSGDFLFLDPPYKPGERQLQQSHFGSNQFRFEDHERLALCLTAASDRGVRWCMTTASHADIVGLFSRFRIIPVPSRKKGTTDSGQVTVLNLGGQQ